MSYCRCSKKWKINIPLVTALNTMPWNAKFLTKLFTKKVRYTDDAQFQVGENIFAMFKRDLPVKYEDPWMFSIPCIIGCTKIERAMLDLGALINVMPLTMCDELKIGLLKPSRAVIQLADKSNVYPKGVVEDVLVKVQDLIFPAYFHVCNMWSVAVKKPLMLLGRPFLKTTRTLINC